MRKRAGKLAKNAVLDVLVPSVYRYYARKPVDEKKILFVEERSDTLSDNFRRIWRALKKEGSWRLCFISMNRSAASREELTRRFCVLAKEMADARAVFLCEANEAVSCVKKRPETKVIQLWHACGAFKKFGMSTVSNKYGPDEEGMRSHPYYRNLDLVAVSSPEVIAHYAEAMDLEDHKALFRPIGVSRTDVYFEERPKEKARKKLLEVFPEAKGKKVILYAPTVRGRPSEARAADGLDTEQMRAAFAGDCVLVIKQHPYVPETDKDENSAKDSDPFVRDLTGQMTIEELLMVSDLCITDYSSLVFEYSLLERPMVFFAYDLEDYEDWRGFYYPYEEMTPGPVVKDMETLIRTVRSSLEHFDASAVRAFREKFMSGCDGKSTGRVLAFLSERDENSGTGPVQERSAGDEAGTLQGPEKDPEKNPLKERRLSPHQEKLLEMMKWYHAFCEEHGLVYFAVGGTMLGAVRHGGFIPWDDDLDVGMPRPDYERFCRIMQEESAQGRFRVETIYMGNPDYLFPHAKVFDTQTTLVEKKKVACRRGLYIDILPIDGTGNTYEESVRFFRPIALRLDFLAARVCAVRPERSFYKNAAIRAAALIPPVLYRENEEMRKIDRICQSRPYDSCEYAADLYGIKRKKEIMPKRYFGTPRLYTFEDTRIYGVEDPEHYLTCLFGDWRQLPPKEEQVTHHDYEYCDLERSWLETP